MSRRRWIYIDGTPYEAGTEPQPLVDSGALWGDRDYANMRTLDGEDISTRTKHREYMRLNGLTTMDDYNEAWRHAEKFRTEYRTTGRGGAVTKEDVARAMHDVMKRNGTR